MTISGMELVRARGVGTLSSPFGQYWSHGGVIGGRCFAPPCNKTMAEDRHSAGVHALANPSGNAKI